MVAFGPAAAGWLEDVVGSDHLNVHCTSSNPCATFSNVDECIFVIREVICASVIKMKNNKLKQKCSKVSHMSLLTEQIGPQKTPYQSSAHC